MVEHQEWLFIYILHPSTDVVGFILTHAFKDIDKLLG